MSEEEQEDAEFWASAKLISEFSHYKTLIHAMRTSLWMLDKFLDFEEDLDLNEDGQLLWDEIQEYRAALKDQVEHFRAKMLPLEIELRQREEEPNDPEAEKFFRDEEFLRDD